MYPLQCKGGYPFPIQAGMKSIAGVMATVNDTTAASRLKLVDSSDNKIVVDGDCKACIADLKGVANSDGTIGVMFPEAVKVRNGVAITSVSSNLVPGSVFVYVR